MDAPPGPPLMGPVWDWSMGYDCARAAAAMAAMAAVLEAAAEEWGVEVMALGRVGKDIPSVADGVEDSGCVRARACAWEGDIMEMGDWDLDLELELEVLW